MFTAYRFLINPINVLAKDVGLPRAREALQQAGAHQYSSMKATIIEEGSKHTLSMKLTKTGRRSYEYRGRRSSNLKRLLADCAPGTYVLYYREAHVGDNFRNFIIVLTQYVSPSVIIEQ